MTHPHTINSLATVAHTPHLGGEVPLELTDALQPVGSCLLTDQLDVEERTLTWTKVVTRGGPSNDTGGHVRHYVLQRVNTRQ